VLGNGGKSYRIHFKDGGGWNQVADGPKESAVFRKVIDRWRVQQDKSGLTNMVEMPSTTAFRLSAFTFHPPANISLGLNADAFFNKYQINPGNARGGIIAGRNRLKGGGKGDLLPRLIVFFSSSDFCIGQEGRKPPPARTD